MQLDARDKRALIGGAVAGTLLVAFLLWPSNEVPDSNVELVPANQRAGAAPIAPPAPVAPPAPIPVVPVGPVQPAAAAPEGITLTGVAGGGAIFAYQDGSQRFVARGREVLPGLRLQGTSLYHVILASPTASYRLGFSGPAVALGAPAGAAPAAPSAAVNPAEAAQQAETARFREALEPRQVNGRVAGYTIRPGANLLVLQRAGLQPGDTILSVNGSALDAERLDELAWSIANASSTVFEVERGGRRMRMTLQGGDLRM